MRHEETTCCIAGGGPAGVVLGYLLARAGVPVVVLEKHADFLRDFRGDTVHPSTLRILDELGLLDRFLERPHQKMRAFEGTFGEETLRIADFAGLPERYAYVAFMPQWDFLDFLTREGAALPTFRLALQHRVDATLEENGRVVGVRGVAPDGDFEVRARLVAACDGRHSTLRAAARLPVENLGVPIDVLWFRIGKEAQQNDRIFARAAPGRMVVIFDRGDYWQCAFVIAKGGFDAVRARGLDAFRARVAEAAPPLAGRVADLASWDDVKLLTVSLDRLRRWSSPGLVCIGDAAHAMSPVGGVGINLAVQDAVATANLLAATLADPASSDAAIDERLDDVRDRRLWPTEVTQRVQRAVHENLLAPVVGGAAGDAVPRPPAALRVVARVPMLQRLLARGLGFGVRPEHVRTPATGG